ncbi:ABC transporter ATP-binding protein [Micromonospora sp. NPDC048905]|uniref:ABC transporter ATP-binding protein n=1 Tax=Micromonospora sp. NPDC048905 TaxID=3155494 RepID=UPI0033E8B296
MTDTTARTAQPVPPENGGRTAAVRADGVTKKYGLGENAVVALDDVTIGLPRGEFTAIMGPSGSGKSTLMHCLAGLDTVSAGRVFVGDDELTEMNDKQLTRLRRDRIGFIFQAFNLVPTLSALENILLPMSVAGRQPDAEWLDTVVDTTGLRNRLDHRPSQLSGGQQQRVACARSLVGRPDVIFADEPTGNLDSRSGGEVLELLRESVRGSGQTIVMVTHDPVAAGYTDHVVFLADGRLIDRLREPTPATVLERMKDLDTRVAAAVKGPRA